MNNDNKLCTVPVLFVCRVTAKAVLVIKATVFLIIWYRALSLS